MSLCKRPSRHRRKPAELMRAAYRGIELQVGLVSDGVAHTVPRDVNSPTTLISHPDVVLIGLRVDSGEAAIRTFETRLEEIPEAIGNPGRLLRDLLERARLSSVCISDDVALPHARTPGVERLVLAVARTDGAVPFDQEHRGIRLIFLVGTPREALPEYLQMVAALSRLLRTPGTRRSLLDAPDEAGFRAIVARAAPQ